MITLLKIKEYCSDAVIAAGDFHVMASLVNAGYVRYQSREVGDGAVSIALGMPDGPLFLMQLESIANMPIENQPQEMLVKIAMCRQVWRSLISKSLDVGNEDVRASIDSMVGVLLTQAQADAVKSLAPTIDAGFTWEQIRSVVQAGG